MAQQDRKKIPKMLYLEAEQWDALKKKSRKTKKPVAQLVREAVDYSLGRFPVVLNGKPGVVLVKTKGARGAA